MTAAAADYVRLIRNLYIQLPGTAGRFSRSDRLLAIELHSRQIPLDVVRSAFLLAAARRLLRNPNIPPLPPIRSLHYFLHVIDEILAQPLPQGYVQYLEHKLAQHT